MWAIHTFGGSFTLIGKRLVFLKVGIILTQISIHPNLDPTSPIDKNHLLNNIKVAYPLIEELKAMQSGFIHINQISKWYIIYLFQTKIYFLDIQQTWVHRCAYLIFIFRQERMNWIDVYRRLLSNTKHQLFYVTTIILLRDEIDLVLLD